MRSSARWRLDAVGVHAGGVRAHRVEVQVVDEPELKVARVNVSDKRDGLAVLEFHYVVATPDGVEHFSEKHEIALFTYQQYLDAFLKAGLVTVHDHEGLMGRGMYVGVSKSA